MSSLVVVAIPEQDDHVWKISSEKVPHMTLLFLGENPEDVSVTQMIGFLHHAIQTTLPSRFGLTVDHRGVLGSDSADVLFFEKRHAEKLAEFRHGLLSNKYFRDAYDSVEQFPEWTPHLTLGYPESPAKEDDREHPSTSWVNFDRIALWTGDSEGPTFPLSSHDDYAEVLMSDPVSEFLEHHGIKGMKWGVRRSRGADGTVGGAGKKSEAVTRPGPRPGTKLVNVKKTSAKDLSTEDLKNVVARMQLEQQYSKLSSQSAPKSAGKEFVGKIVKDVASTQIKNALNKKIEKEIEKELTRRAIRRVGRTAGGLAKGVAGPILTKV